ncbi:hypothetical protein FY136_28540 (plasmid) [Agrobacterium tumefaciens]|uniref:hypothetical protein n=1 Tax=Agrobacterium tumefaciens TaxID=358 RepID=UPI0021CEF162|nr:hypothetical protein [Agrobacterium tumefaciens]UXT53212.1 hypothetical protein FY136_28540 [Agrobacterium tumefaciens]
MTKIITSTRTSYILTIETARSRIRAAGYSTRAVSRGRQLVGISIPERGVILKADPRGYVTLDDLLVALGQRRAA